MKKNYTNPTMSLLKYAAADVIGTTSAIGRIDIAAKNDGSVIATSTVKISMADILKLD